MRCRVKASAALLCICFSLNFLAADTSARCPVPLVQLSLSDQMETYALWNKSAGWDGGGAFRGLACADAVLNLERLGMPAGSQLHCLFQNGHGRGLLGEGLQNVQTISSLDVRSFSHLSEFWLEVPLGSGRVLLKAGQMDVCNDFACVDSASAFINSSFGAIPIQHQPNFPDPKPGINMTVAFSPRWEIRAGLYGGAHSEWGMEFREIGGVYSTGEFRGNIGDGGLMSFGIWGNTSRTEYLGRHPWEGFLPNKWGMYASGEWSLKTGPQLFVQAGISRGGLGCSSVYSEAGVTISVPGRSNDLVGLAVTSLWYPFRERQRTSECLAEAFYRLRLSDWVWVQPDMQIMTLGAAGKPFLAMGVRLGFSWEWKFR